MKSSAILSAAVVAMLAGAADAAIYTWNRTVTSSDNRNNSGGVFESLAAEFDTATNRFVWNATFSNQITRGFTLAVSPGGSPRGDSAEVAQLYFDASNLSAPKVTAYAYNGRTSPSSWYDGNGLVSGSQTPDMIHGATNTSWIQHASVVDANGKRTFRLVIDATMINNHDPIYDQSSAVGDWTGVRFGPLLGVWMQTFTGLQTSYASNGRLCGWSYNDCYDGWYESGCNNVVLVPLPAPVMMGLAGLGVVGFVARRRVKALAN